MNIEVTDDSGYVVKSTIRGLPHQFYYTTNGFGWVITNIERVPGTLESTIHYSCNGAATEIIEPYFMLGG